MDWAKVYIEMPTDVKLLGRSVSDKWLWTCLILRAHDNDQDRGVVPHDEAEPRWLAKLTGVPAGTVKLALTYFERRGMTRTEECGLRLINYGKRQHRKPSDEPEAVRKRVAKHRGGVREILRSRDGDNCGICGEPLTEPVEVDHIIPRVEGGSDDRSNLRLTHLSCNQKRGQESLVTRRAIARNAPPSRERPTESRDQSTEYLSPPAPPSKEAAKRSLERDAVLAWAKDTGYEPDYPNANRLCVSEGWTAAEIITACKAVARYKPTRILTYIQSTQNGAKSSVLSRMRVQREEAEHNGRKTKRDASDKGGAGSVADMLSQVVQG